MDMRFKNIALASVLVAAFVFAGCGKTSPIVTIEGAPVVAYSNAPTMKKIEKAIISAGISRGWKMEPSKPGHIVGTLALRQHMVKVDITYDTKSYNIRYKDSGPTMLYDGTNIHRQYNNWVLNLDRSIRAALSQV